MLTDEQRAALVQELAAIEHQRWSDWQAWCHKVLRDSCPSPELESVLERWDRQIATQYVNLTEPEKQSDRDQVERYMPIIERLLADRTVPKQLSVEYACGAQDYWYLEDDGSLRLDIPQADVVVSSSDLPDRAVPDEERVERAAEAIYYLDPSMQRLWFSEDGRSTGFLDEPIVIEWDVIRHTPGGEILRKWARAALTAAGDAQGVGTQIIEAAHRFIEAEDNYKNTWEANARRGASQQAADHVNQANHQRRVAFIELKNAVTASQRTETTDE